MKNSLNSFDYKYIHDLNDFRVPPAKRSLVRIDKMLSGNDKNLLARSQKIPPHNLSLQKIKYINSVLDFVP